MIASACMRLTRCTKSSCHRMYASVCFSLSLAMSHACGMRKRAQNLMRATSHRSRWCAQGAHEQGGVLLVVRASSRRNWRWRDSPGYEKPDRPTAPTFSESSSAPPRSGRTPVSGARISYHVRSIRSKARAILARLRRKTQRMPITEPKMENTSGSKSASTSPCASRVRCQAEVLPHNVDTTLARKEEDCTELRAAMLAIHARSVRLAWDGFK